MTKIIGIRWSGSKKINEARIKNIQSFDWNFEYNSDTFSGTGNAYVDQILDAYVLTQMVVI